MKKRGGPKGPRARKLYIVELGGEQHIVRAQSVVEALKYAAAEIMTVRLVTPKDMQFVLDYQTDHEIHEAK